MPRRSSPDSLRLTKARRSSDPQRFPSRRDPQRLEADVSMRRRNHGGGELPIFGGGLLDHGAMTAGSVLKNFLN